MAVQNDLFASLQGYCLEYAMARGLECLNLKPQASCTLDAIKEIRERRLQPSMTDSVLFQTEGATLHPYDGIEVHINAENSAQLPHVITANNLCFRNEQPESEPEVSIIGMEFKEETNIWHFILVHKPNPNDTTYTIYDSKFGWEAQTTTNLTQDLSLYIQNQLTPPTKTLTTLWRTEMKPLKPSLPLDQN